MAKINFPTEEEFAKNVAEKALDEYLYEGKTIREWIKIIAEQESKTGHWKRVSIDKYTESAKYWYRCDKCGEKNLGNTNYCPNCGEKMSETPTGSESEE